ncbi:hypothetical protein ACFFHC_10225 [Kytococcus schroeteri]|uniref:hypothetical protein n=1 Tax=Kytococcus schroeteri TaxID=138300 RepID=UPI0035E63EA8
MSRIIFDPFGGEYVFCGCGVYRITLTRPMAAWANADFIWPDAHWFAPAERDSVSIRVESLGGVVGPKTDNNLAVYDNNGKGF